VITLGDLGAHGEQRAGAGQDGLAIASRSADGITLLSPLDGMGGTAECLGSKDVGVSRVERKDFTPGALPLDLRPHDADAFHH
jgi:hypothetical protein